MTTGYVHPQLHAEVVAALQAKERTLELQLATTRAREDELRQALHDANVQAAFWRRAAKDAVEGWCALEDKVDSAVQILQRTENMYDKGIDVDDALKILVEADPLEPPELEAVLRELPEVDLGDGHKLRVVEEETPIKKV